VRIVLLQAEGLFRTRKLKRSIIAYQNAIEKIDTKEKLKDFGCQAWKDLGTVFAARDQYYEAGLAFQEGERNAQLFIQGQSLSSLRDKKMKKLWEAAAECCYLAYRALKMGFDATKKGKQGSEYLKNLYSKQRQYLTQKYPDSVFAKNLQFFAGQDLLRQEKYLDAVLSFQSVDPKSQFYETSLVGIGQAYFKEFSRRKAEEEAKIAKMPPEQRPATLKLSASIKDFLEKSKASFEKFLQLAESKKVEGDEAESRRRVLHAYTYFFLSRVYTEKEEWPKVLEVLEGFEENYKDKLDLVLTAVFLKLQAYYRLKKPVMVEDMLRIMDEVDEQLKTKQGRKKKHTYLIIGYQLAGAIYGEMAMEAKKKLELEAYREYNNKAADYLWTWIENDILVDIGSGDPNEVLNKLDAVGIKMFKAKEFDKAVKIYESILAKLQTTLSPDQALRFQRKVGDCYIELGEWEKALDVYKGVYEAKKAPMFLEKLVLIYTKLGDKFSDAGDAQNANLNYDEALKLYNVVLKQDEPEKPQWWRWKLAVWGIMFKKGEYKKVVKQITNAELLYPTLRGKGIRESIKKLQDNAKELAGSRKR
jgi:tetratricopeptide (TPR) repeat protein